MHTGHAAGSLFLIAMLVLPSPASSARKEPAVEDTAHISLQKTARPSKKTKTYRVKPGDSISKIMQQIPDMTVHRYTRLKELNPALKDIDMIYPGQVLLLPFDGSSGEPGKGGTTYVTRKGDSLTRIIIRRFPTNAADIAKITRRIKELNPEITNPDRIYPGQILLLPDADADGRKAETAETPEAPVASAIPDVSGAASTAEKVPQAEGDANPEEKPAPVQDKRLAVISRVIKQMNGNVISNGSYFIPLANAGRVAIDCAAIPIAELNDGSILLMDFAGRLPESLRNVIQANWKNYSLVRISPQEDTAAALQKIIGAARNYTMARWGKPLTIGNNSRIQVSPDWMITRKSPPGGIPYRQGLFFLNDASQLLPRPLISYAAKNGFVITEIIAGTGVADGAESTAALPDVPVISGSTPLETVANLLALFDYQAVRDAEVNIFNTARDGFNLTVKAGLLVKSGDRQLIFHSKKLPQQFLDILKEGKTDVVVIADNEDGRSAVEKALRAMNIAFTQDTFSFSLPGRGNKTGTTFSFPAIKAEGNRGPLYLINFALDPDIRELLRIRWGAEIIRY